MLQMVGMKKYIVRRYLHLEAIIFYEANYFCCLRGKLVMKVKCLREVLFRAEHSRLTRMAKRGGKIKQEGKSNKVFPPVSQST